MTAYYNENDPFAAAWLQSLIEKGLICAGTVDQRSIEEITPSDLAGYDQHHFFAGIGVWSYALRNAGWSDNTRVWTGSCPCQSFSSSGKRSGFDDKRHLWPAWFRLIEKYRPDVIFGEQVASKDGLAWFDVVSADLERTGYAVGAADLCAAGVGAPHRRQRIFFVADADTERRSEHSRIRQEPRDYLEAAGNGEAGGMANTGRQETPSGFELGGQVFSVGDAGRERRQQKRGSSSSHEKADGRARRNGSEPHGDNITPGAILNGYWRGAEWLYCNDPDGPKWRAVEPGSFPLVTGATSRVGRLRGYGNSIVAPAAQAFIEAWIEANDAMP